MRVRARLRWLDTLPEPDRTWARLGIPPDEWPRYSDWVSQAIAAMKEARRS